MPRGSIVQIGNHQYRYHYDPTSQKTIYDGPVGSAPEIGEEEFMDGIKSEVFGYELDGAAVDPPMLNHDGIWADPDRYIFGLEGGDPPKTGEDLREIYYDIDWVSEPGGKPSWTWFRGWSIKHLDLDIPLYAPKEDRRGDSVHPGDYVSVKTHPRGTARGTLEISESGWFQEVGGEKLPVLVVRSDEGTLYSPAPVLKLKIRKRQD